MKKIISIILIGSVFLTQNPMSYADNPPVINEVQAEKDLSKNINQDIAQTRNDEVKKLCKEEKPNEKLQQTQNFISNELVEAVSNELEEYQQNFEENSGPSKWEITKNVAKCMGNKFVQDLKNYVSFYPLSMVARTIAFFIWFIPCYLLYKKLGIDVPGKISEFAFRHNNWAIIIQNLYNVIPMTIASFMYKYGHQAYTYLKR